MEYMQEGRKTKESMKRELITCHAGRSRREKFEKVNNILNTPITDGHK